MNQNTIKTISALEYISTITKWDNRLKEKTNKRQLNTVIRKSFKFNDLDITNYKVNKLKDLVKINDDLDFLIEKFIK